MELSRTQQNRRPHGALTQGQPAALTDTGPPRSSLLKAIRSTSAIPPPTTEPIANRLQPTAEPRRGLGADLVARNVLEGTLERDRGSIDQTEEVVRIQLGLLLIGQVCRVGQNQFEH